MTTPSAWRRRSSRPATPEPPTVSTDIKFAPTAVNISALSTRGADIYVSPGTDVFLSLNMGTVAEPGSQRESDTNGARALTLIDGTHIGTSGHYTASTR